MLLGAIRRGALFTMGTRCLIYVKLVELCIS
jgi:hypothetical protein